MTSTNMTAEEILAHQRDLARKRLRRYRERHPDRMAEYRARYARAEAALRDLHREEYLNFAAAQRRDRGDSYQQSYRAATSELRRLYPDEWADLLATTP